MASKDYCNRCTKQCSLNHPGCGRGEALVKERKLELSVGDDLEFVGTLKQTRPLIQCTEPSFKGIDFDL